MIEYTLNGKTYIDLKDVRDEHKDYCKGTRTNSQLVQTKNFKDYIYGRIYGESLVATEKLSRKFGSIFVNKEELNGLNDNIVPPAPPLIETDEPFYIDDEGNEYHVPMRGERTKDGIFFRVKSVMEVFKMNNLQSNIQLAHTGYTFNVDYVFFTVDDIKEMYLTYSGLIKVFHSSRSINCQQNYGYVYLIKLESNGTIYKFGKTWDINVRMRHHRGYYASHGFNEIKLVKKAKIDIEKLSEAEAAIKRYLESRGSYLKTEYSDELGKIESDNEYNDLIDFYDKLEEEHFSDTSYDPCITLDKFLNYRMGVDDHNEITFALAFGTQERKTSMISDTNDFQKKLDQALKEIETLKLQLEQHKVD